jgi:uncharacterized protein YndB with AHSA1/START domain
MAGRSVEHAAFVIERSDDAAPARVFAAWATREQGTRDLLDKLGEALLREKA